MARRVLVTPVQVGSIHQYTPLEEARVVYRALTPTDREQAFIRVLEHWQRAELYLREIEKAGFIVVG